MKLQRYEKNPILSPNPNNAWESEVTTNPGAYYDEQEKKVYLLYRAAGSDKEHKIYFGLATSTDGYSFTRVSDSPVFGPSIDGFDGGCVEDARITKMDGYFYITYATRAFPPGEYWITKAADPSYVPLETLPDSFPKILKRNLTTTGLALTKDFKSFHRVGRMTNPTVDDRDVILFPEKINGKFVMIHRPKDWVGKEYGTENPGMWIARGDDPLTMGDSVLLMNAKYPWETKVGGNTPPIRTPYGWFTLYHATGKDQRYRLGALLLDLNDPTKVLHRTPDWLIEPTESYELEGYYQGVIFPCGTAVINDTLFVYYGGADKYVGLATCSFSDLLTHLRSCPN